MHFGGLQKISLIDYPGKLSCVIFISGCNFNCPYCHNPSLVKGYPECPHLLKSNGLYDFLKSRLDFLDGVVISGGEPTLQKGLFRLCESIKKLGYSVKLDTNGSRPRELKKLIKKGLVDYVAMDIKTDTLNYAPSIKNDCNPEDLLSSIHAIMESAPVYEFRTTCVKEFVDERIIEGIAKVIKGARRYVLQKFHRTKLLNPEFFRKSDIGHNQEEILSLKSIAEPWVKECLVR